MISAVLMLATLGAGPVFVEPADLARRPDLVGREVVVDDRVRFFLESKRGQGYDELMLKRTEVPFRLPVRLKFTRSPSEPNARVMGTLNSEGGRLVFEVVAIEMLPADLTRLDHELSRLRPEDFAGKRVWALWAERRGKELNDPKLEERGVELEGEALWTEASRPEADNLALAVKSARRPVAESLRNALAHRGFLDRQARATTPAELDALAKQIESMLPASADPKSSAVADQAFLGAYAKDPASTYRDAPEAVRASLDRRLLADVIQRSLERQVEARPTDAAKLAEIAHEKLPDRPDFADGLRRRGLVEAEARVTTMRQSEVEDLARKFQEQGDKDRATRLIRTWLADRRKTRLSVSDAEGRILLADSYEKLLGDRRTAAELLQEALVIDPQSRAAVDAFLRMGYRKGDAGWYDPNTTKTPGNPAPEAGALPNNAGAPAEASDSLKGLTRAQVRSRLGGKPDLIVRSASQGQSVELWIYKNGKGSQIVRFLFEPGTTEPRASAYYSDRK